MGSPFPASISSRRNSITLALFGGCTLIECIQPIRLRCSMTTWAGGKVVRNTSQFDLVTALISRRRVEIFQQRAVRFFSLATDTRSPNVRKNTSHRSIGTCVGGLVMFTVSSPYAPTEHTGKILCCQVTEIWDD